MTKSNSKRRWAVLGMYAAVAGLSQYLWLNFAPLVLQIEQKFGVTEDKAGLLLLVFPFIYVFLSLPAGALIDKRGYRFGIGIGVSLMAVFACLRIFDSSFWILLVGQIGIAVGQPFVVNGISKLVLDWFSKEEEAIATGIGTVGMFLGMSISLASTPAIFAAWGLQATMAVCAVIAVAVCAGFFAVVHPNPERRDHGELPQATVAGEFVELLRHRGLVLLFILSFLGLGFFNGLTTWLEPILAVHGISSVQAGLVGSVMIIGGVAGAAIVPAISDRVRRRKPFLIGSVLAALATLYPLSGSGNFSLLLALGAALGFFFLPAYSILLEMCSELAGSQRAGAATGLLMLTGNAGAVSSIIAMQAVRGSRPDFGPAIDLLGAAAIVAVILALCLRETHPLAHSKRAA